MRRVKRQINVLIAGTLLEEDVVFESAKRATVYADTVFLAFALPAQKAATTTASLKQRAAEIPDVKLVLVFRDRDTRNYRDAAYGSVVHHLVEPRGQVILFLEAAQHVDEPDLVRPGVELNADKILTATRSFQWDTDHHRVDGIYRPARFPVAGPMKMGIHWDDPLSTAPAWMWNDTPSWVEVPFEIIDRTYMNPTQRFDDGVPKLQPTRGRLFA